MARYIQGYKYITIHHTVTSPAKTKADLPALAKSIEAYHKTKSYAEIYKTGGEFGYYYAQYHYLFAQDGSYIQLHDTKYQRVHATDSARGDTSHNLHGIALAIAGNMDTTAPSAALQEGLSKLSAELERKYKVSFAIRGHKETAVYVKDGVVYYPEKTGVYYTACPGAYMGTSKAGVIKNIIARTNELLVTKPWYEVATPKKIRLTNPKTAYLYAIDTQEKVKEYPANSVIGTDYIWEDYYITEFSINNKIKNGFKKAEWQEYLPEENLETCKLEVQMLQGELAALKTSYDALSVALEEKNNLIDESNFEITRLKDSVKKLEFQIVDKDIVIKRLNEDIAFCDDQELDYKAQIQQLKTELEKCASQGIVNTPWPEIFSGILAKLKGTKS